jgi:hypothetical protein
VPWGFLSGLLFLAFCRVPNYGVEQGEAILQARRRRMVVARMRWHAVARNYQSSPERGRMFG